jgi:hydroxymethylpyrimidine pyrophosphatase-like HAD family hydrolase
MEKNIKNIITVFDIDGTLMPISSSILDPNGTEALSKAAELGEVVIASARLYQGIFFLIKDLPSKPRVIIALNGAATFIDGKLVDSVAIPEDTVGKVTGILTQLSIYNHKTPLYGILRPFFWSLQPLKF